MPHARTAKEVFDDWALDHHADGMERHHKPRVEQAWRALTPEIAAHGDYLEVGVGNGYAIRHMATTLFASRQCFGLDVSGHMVERARVATADLKNVRIECGNFLEWEPAGTRFGLIFSMEVFYYFADIQRGIEHACRLLQPGGTLAVLVNYYREHRASHAWPDDLDTPMTLWSAAQYREGFERAGLVAVRQDFYTDPPAEATPGDPGTLATWGVRGAS